QPPGHRLGLPEPRQPRPGPRALALPAKQPEDAPLAPRRRPGAPQELRGDLLRLGLALRNRLAPGYAGEAARLPRRRGLPGGLLRPRALAPVSPCKTPPEEEDSMRVTEGMKVFEVLSNHPGAFAVFRSHGCPDMRAGFFRFMSRLMSVRR